MVLIIVLITLWDLNKQTKSHIKNTYCWLSLVAMAPNWLLANFYIDCCQSQLMTKEFRLTRLKKQYAYAPLPVLFTGLSNIVNVFVLFFKCLCIYSFPLADLCWSTTIRLLCWMLFGFSKLWWILKRIYIMCFNRKWKSSSYLCCLVCESHLDILPIMLLLTVLTKSLPTCLTWRL